MNAYVVIQRADRLFWRFLHFTLSLNSSTIAGLYGSKAYGEEMLTEAADKTDDLRDARRFGRPQPSLEVLPSPGTGV